MPLLIDSLRFAAIFLLILMGLLVLRSEGRSFRKNILIVFLLANIGYLLAYWPPIQNYPAVFQIPFFFSVSFPLTFWLVSKAFFDENFQWTKRYTFIAILIPAIHFVLYTLNEHVTAKWYSTFRFIPYLISVFFIIMVIIESIRNRQNDLVTTRLKARNIFIVFAALIALSSLYFFFVKDPLDLPDYLELIQILVMITFILLFFYSQINFRPLFETMVLQQAPVASSSSNEKQDKIIKKLQVAFQQERYYLQEGITITSLSKAVEEKEYLLRKAINGQLGYTNFNAFLNHYRIKEACELLDSKEDLTFQEIAYRLGYQSVATFNRAFKKETGLTPTDYRKHQGIG